MIQDKGRGEGEKEERERGERVCEREFLTVAEIHVVLFYYTILNQDYFKFNHLDVDFFIEGVLRS